MISKAFQKFRSSKAMIIGAVCLLALVLLTAGIVWRVSGAVSGIRQIHVYYKYANPKDAKMIHGYYKDSVTGEDGSTHQPLFEDKYVVWNTNPGGSITLIGGNYVKTFNDFANNGVTWHKVSNSQLDCETFYLDKPTSGEGLQWAYTFVGWHIVDAKDEYIPMETVFQPGDVIPAHVIERFGKGNSKENSLVFESLWARCIFVQDRTDSNVTDTNNIGNDPAKPLETVRQAFNIRNEGSTGNVTGLTQQQKNELGKWKDYNAYSHAIMLTGDVTVNRDGNNDNYADMFSSYAFAYPVTFKSLQATRTVNGNTVSFQDKPGARYSMNFSLYNIFSNIFRICGSTRFDNVNFKQKTEVIFHLVNMHGNNGNEDDEQANIKNFGVESISKTGHYFETTARFTTELAGAPNYLYIRAYSCERVVLNGGTLGGVYVGWSLPKLYSQDVEHTWYFGRKLVVGEKGSVVLGLNNTTANGEAYNSKDRVIITGGKIPALYGAGVSMGDDTAITGYRNYILYGLADHQPTQLKSDVAYEYDPQIGKFYGGGYNYKLNGDITVKAYSCSKLGEFYAGGYGYPAVVTGNITSTFENCDFSGIVSGGGQYANTTGDGMGNVILTFTEGSTAAGNVYGSGMGFVTTFTKTDWDKLEKPDAWEEAPTGFPAAEPQDDGSVWILATKYKKRNKITGENDLRYVVESLYYFVSTAKANRTNVVVDNSIVKGNLYGGGDYASVVGDTSVIVRNGAHIGGAEGGGSVYGGSDASRVLSSIELYKPCEGAYTPPTALNEEINYGTKYPQNFSWTNDDALKDAGIDFTNYLVYTDAQKGEVGGNTSVSVTTNATVAGNVFGGGNQGPVKKDTNVTVSATVGGSVFGGCSEADVEGNVNVTVNDGADIYWYIFGGNDQGGVIGGDITTVMNGGTVREDIYGSSRSTAFTNKTYLTIEGGTVENDVFGGGFKGNAGETDVTVSGGTIKGNLYGGGDEGSVRNTTLTINGGNFTYDAGTDAANSAYTVYGIFGGGNKNNVTGTTTVTISNGTIGSATHTEGIAYGVFGGGRNGEVNGADGTSVTINGGTINHEVFGGGYGEKATVENTQVNLVGGTFRYAIYGGGYKGKVIGDTKVFLRPDASIYSTVYGGGNEGDIGGSTQIHAYSKYINAIFGGCSAASVANNTAVTLYDGALIDFHLYGGNRTSGDIGGETTVTVKGGTVEGYVFGGGESATTDANTYVIIEGGNVCVGAGSNEKGGVYGGGFAAGVGKATVTINGGTVGSDAWAGSVYGGSCGAGSSVNETVVNVENGTVKGNVYGGGYAGTVNTNTNVTISGGVAENAFGGGYMGDVNGNTALKVTGGTLTSAFGGNDTSGVINGTITVDVEGGTIDELYGGGSQAHINADTTDSISLNINGGTVVKGFGGGMLAYTALTPKVTVTGGNVTALYGGGYQAATVGSDVTVNNGTIVTLYGGGYAGAVGDTKLVIDDGTDGVITINGNVYGGGEGITATVNGTTDVTINTHCSFTATETPITTMTESTASGAVETAVTDLTHRSTINGSVYGGGNQGRVGEGIIYVGGESAKVASAGKTNVLISNGYIGGSVFAGGRGNPGEGQRYDVSMGTVFGSTDVTVNGGYIEGNLYGGGEQSRVYSNGQATNVLIQEVADMSFAIKGSVFGGGDRGEEGATNASVPTVIGDVNVAIVGLDENTASNIYFLEGGVYGDGNLCLVKGERTIDITNFKASSETLKTFYSLQRADTVTMDNSAVVLLGAKDLVAENDERVYSINRVGHLQMVHGSTVKLDQIVNYLGELSSDVHNSDDPDDGRFFIHLGNNGENDYTDGGCDDCYLDPLDEPTISAYRNNQIHNGEKNVVCVANGLYLEVKNEAGKYGPVTGLFTLQLLHANPGEGGGFVYGSIPESTGDFICETKMSTFTVATVANQAELDAGRFYVRAPGRGYERATGTYDSTQTYYTANVSDEYMDIIDNVGGYRNSSYSYYYWYIGGPEVRYNINITGYIGIGKPTEQSVSIPQHASPLAYVLYSVDVNDTLAAALMENTYSLQNHADNLTGNEIAIEIKLGNQSLGFLTKEGDNWAIASKNVNMIGYRGSSTAAANNVLFTGAVDQANDTITWVLHKSADVEVEKNDMAVFLDIDKFEVNDQGDLSNVVTESATLSFSSYISIVKLLPTQYLYHDNLRSYTGVGSSSAIAITGNSCFTAEYQTNYIPATYPSGSDSMTWSLKSASSIPADTKITMIDLSGDVPTYYYYICDSDTPSIDLTNFMQMGTKTTIASMGTKPAFINAYASQEMDLFNERLLFVFDFEQASESLPVDTYTNTITLNHMYDSKDIMDYVKAGVTYAPKEIENFHIGVGQDGIGTFSAAFGAESYGDNETAILNVHVTEDEEWINTLFREYGLAVEVDLANAESMPAGMYISYMGQTYYPGADSTVISVPIYEFGDHVLQICNPHGGLADVLNDSTSVAKFNVSFYCAPDAMYHKVENVSGPVNASFTVVGSTSLNSLQVVPGSSSRILSTGDTLEFTVNTDTGAQVLALEEQAVNVKLFHKENGSYVEVDMASVFSEIGETVKSGAQSWKLTGGVSGTYRIEFNYANNTEYLNFIIP